MCCDRCEIVSLSFLFSPSSRVVFSGSLDFFSDEFLTSSVQKAGGGKKHPVSGNRALAAALASWCFKQSGVLRVKGITHHRVGEPNPPELFYTIREDVVYAIDIEEFSGGKWIPFQADDVQMEFHRIDPFVRLTLEPNKGRYVVFAAFTTVPISTCLNSC